MPESVQCAPMAVKLVRVAHTAISVPESEISPKSFQSRIFRDQAEMKQGAGRTNWQTASDPALGLKSLRVRVMPRQFAILRPSWASTEVLSKAVDTPLASSAFENQDEIDHEI